jgi:hypothetical protein
MKRAALTMDVDFSDVDLGLVVSLAALREALKGMNIDGRRWWISSDPHDAAEAGFISIGHGCKGCSDRLNTLHFRVPVVGNQGWKARTDRLILLIDPSTASAEDPGYYLEDGRIVQDSVEDFFCFYQPVERALIARLQARN